MRTGTGIILCAATLCLMAGCRRQDAPPPADEPAPSRETPAIIPPEPDPKTRLRQFETVMDHYFRRDPVDEANASIRKLVTRYNDWAQENRQQIDSAQAALKEESEAIDGLKEQIERMEHYMRLVMEIEPEHAHAYNALGYTLAERGVRLDEAEELIARALELAPNDPFILDSMGWVRFRQNDAESALVYLQRAYAMRSDPEIAAHLGEVLWALKRRDEANAIWNEALREHPDNSVLGKTVQRLRGQ